MKKLNFLSINTRPTCAASLCKLLSKTNVKEEEEKKSGALCDILQLQRSRKRASSCTHVPLPALLSCLTMPAFICKAWSPCSDDEPLEAGHGFHCLPPLDPVFFGLFSHLLTLDCKKAGTQWSRHGYLLLGISVFFPATHSILFLESLLPRRYLLMSAATLVLATSSWLPDVRGCFMSCKLLRCTLMSFSWTLKRSGLALGFHEWDTVGMGCNGHVDCTYCKWYFRHFSCQCGICVRGGTSSLSISWYSQQGEAEIFACYSTQHLVGEEIIWCASGFEWRRWKMTFWLSMFGRFWIAGKASYRAWRPCWSRAFHDRMLLLTDYCDIRGASSWERYASLSACYFVNSNVMTNQILRSLLCWTCLRVADHLQRMNLFVLHAGRVMSKLGRSVAQTPVKWKFQGAFAVVVTEFLHGWGRSKHTLWSSYTYTTCGAGSFMNQCVMTIMQVKLPISLSVISLFLSHSEL